MAFLVTCSLLDLKKNINQYCISIIIIMDIIKESLHYNVNLKCNHKCNAEKKNYAYFEFEYKYKEVFFNAGGESVKTL